MNTPQILSAPQLVDLARAKGYSLITHNGETVPLDGWKPWGKPLAESCARFAVTERMAYLAISELAQFSDAFLGHVLLDGVAQVEEAA